MGNEVILAISNIIFLATGYYIGLNKSDQQLLKNKVKRINKPKNTSHNIGVVSTKLTDKEIEDQSIDKGELNAMSRTLKKLINKPLQ